MGSTNASYLGSSSDSLGSIGRGGTSNKTSSQLQISRNRSKNQNPIPSSESLLGAALSGQEQEAGMGSPRSRRYGEYYSDFRSRQQRRGIYGESQTGFDDYARAQMNKLLSRLRSLDLQSPSPTRSRQTTERLKNRAKNKYKQSMNEIKSGFDQGNTSANKSGFDQDR